jgi:transcriptional regulator with XRE-family HTH domain
VAPNRDSDTAEGPHEIERLDVAQLGRLLRERRGKLSLRQAAADAGVSFSTMSRVEAGSQPDLASFTALCAWLRMPPSAFFTPVVARHREPLEDVLQHLQADPRLTQKAADAISGMLREMYDRLAEQARPSAPLVACHLRAAPVMRPGVPARLGLLLQDLHAGLEKMIDRGDL